MAHTCNPSNSRGRDQEDLGFKANPSQIVCKTLFQKYPTQNRAGRMAPVACVASMRPWVQTSTKKKKERERERERCNGGVSYHLWSCLWAYHLVSIRNILRLSLQVASLPLVFMGYIHREIHNISKHPRASRSQRNHPRSHIHLKEKSFLVSNLCNRDKPSWSWCQYLAHSLPPPHTHTHTHTHTQTHTHTHTLIPMVFSKPKSPLIQQNRQKLNIAF
jgi:hypothetical protein